MNACGRLNESLSRWCDWGAATTTAHKQAQTAHMSLSPFLLKLSSRHETTSVTPPFWNARSTNCIRWFFLVVWFHLLLEARCAKLVVRFRTGDGARLTDYWAIQPGDGDLELERRIGSLRSGWARCDTPTLLDQRAAPHQQATLDRRRRGGSVVTIDARWTIPALLSGFIIIIVGQRWAGCQNRDEMICCEFKVNDKILV